MTGKKSKKRIGAFGAYANAADRIRSGEPQPMDEAVCEWWYGTQAAYSAGSYRSVYDLPIASRMWNEVAS
jgi:hypothetical protein